MKCHSERSEESRVLIGQIIIKATLPDCTTKTHLFAVGILPRPKVRSE